MRIFVAVALPCWAGVAWAAGHTMDIRVSNGMTVYSQTVKLSDGQQANLVGPVKGGKEMIFNALLGSDSGNPGQYQLQYQLELSGGRGSQGSSIQVQSELRMRAGADLIALECGSWTVELSLDAPGTLGKKGKKTPAVWDDGGLGNYRLSADVVRGSVRQRCRMAVWRNSQANVVERSAANKHGFIFNVLPADVHAGSINLQYQLEYSPVGMTPLQLQNEETLTLGRQSQTNGQGYKLGLLAEAATPRPASQP